MAGPCTRRNPPFGGEDELAEAPTEGNSTPAISRAPTPAPAQALAPTSAPTPASVPGPPGRYTDKNLQRTTKLALELFVKGQEHGQANSALWDRALKARNPDLYYESSHMECYYFCRQYEDHFDTAGATGHKRVSFAASFL